MNSLTGAHLSLASGNANRRLAVNVQPEPVHLLTVSPHPFYRKRMES